MAPENPNVLLKGEMKINEKVGKGQGAIKFSTTSDALVHWSESGLVWWPEKEHRTLAIIVQSVQSLNINSGNDVRDALCCWVITRLGST